VVDAAWRSLRWPGTEHVRVSEAEDGWHLEGWAVHVMDGTPSRAHYRLGCDRHWSARSLVITLAGAHPPARRELYGDGAGGWKDARGQVLADLDGARDIDISSTPATNTLPVRRLRLQPGDECRLKVVYIRLPVLTVSVVEQTYRCTSVSFGQSRYRYSSGSFSTEFQVDDHGLVADYPGVWERIPLGHDDEGIR